MLNREVLVRDPKTYHLADGGYANVLFPPKPENYATLREQLQTFVCKGAYADGLRRILEAFNGAAGRKIVSPAAWVSGFYGSGKSLLANILGALWMDLTFDDGATAEGLIPGLLPEIRVELRELRSHGKRLGGLVVGGGTLGRGSQHPVKAVLEIILRALDLPARADLRPTLVALWLAKQGVLAQVRASMGDDFEDGLTEFLLDERLATAAWTIKPSLAPDVNTLMDRLSREFDHEPEPTVELMVEKAQQALTIGGKNIPLTLIILDEVQQFLRENPDHTIIVDTIVRTLTENWLSTAKMRSPLIR